MIYPGRYNTLRVVKKVDFGVYLDGQDREEILLPKRYVPDACEVDDEVEVFIYFDSEDRIIATTETPRLTHGECAFLRVVSVAKHGAYVDWGLPKDLFVPHREQSEPMEEGRSYIVFLAYDPQSDRLFGSSRLEYYLDNTSARYEVGDAVEIIVADKTDLGYKAIIENRHWGLIYHNEVFTRINYGMPLTAYIKEIRFDGKIDLMLQKKGYEHVEEVTDQILIKLRQSGGTIMVSDKSSPLEIQDIFAMSKKTFKQAIGALYKKRQIIIEDHSISITHKGRSADVGE